MTTRPITKRKAVLGRYQRKLSFSVVISKKYQVLKKLGSVVYMLPHFAIFPAFWVILGQHGTKYPKYGNEGPTIYKVDPHFFKI